MGLLRRFVGIISPFDIIRVASCRSTLFLTATCNQLNQSLWNFILVYPNRCKVVWSQICPLWYMRLWCRRKGIHLLLFVCEKIRSFFICCCWWRRFVINKNNKLLQNKKKSFIIWSNCGSAIIMSASSTSAKAFHFWTIVFLVNRHRIH